MAAMRIVSGVRKPNAAGLPMFELDDLVAVALELLGASGERAADLVAYLAQVTRDADANGRIGGRCHREGPRYAWEPRTAQDSASRFQRLGPLRAKPGTRP